MRFTLYEPTALSPHELFHLAKEAERCGFDAFSLNDATFQMKTTRGVYPYSNDNAPNWDREAPFYEPMTILPAVAMQTTTLRVFPSVIKLPLHHPLPFAKQVATAAVMSGDRFALGVGASWAPEEYQFCGVDWHKRGKIMTESIEALRLLLTGEWVEYHGEVIDFDPVIARPAPRVPVKIYVGGHHEPSLRRAARLADGWIAAGPATIAEVKTYIDRLRELCAEYGRDWSAFEIHAYPRDARTLDDYRRLEEIGVTDAGTMPINAGGQIVMSETTRQRLTGVPIDAARDIDAIYSTAPPAEKLDAVRRFADTIIAHWK
ncbi:MAG: TIGR03619 family F420-dependent LLM class oxidoreductase [Dehalococcoidia bacterium]|nr:TIGR03619 family F420-dependent LLM class oxidoreductase [Dehalococcoidia bacterium]